MAAGLGRIRRRLSSLHGDQVLADQGRRVMNFYHEIVLAPALATTPKVHARRKIETIAAAIDCLVEGNTTRCGDLLLGRYKALEEVCTDGRWDVAREVEVLPQEDNRHCNRRGAATSGHDPSSDFAASAGGSGSTRPGFPRESRRRSRALGSRQRSGGPSCSSSRSPTGHPHARERIHTRDVDGGAGRVGVGRRGRSSTRQEPCPPGRWSERR